MKQNERLLVYAVTGFLALILVVAVVFGDAPRAVTGEQPATSNSLGDLLGGGAPADASPDQGPASVATGSGATGGGATGGSAAGSAAPASGLSGPVAAKLEQPLRVAAPTPAALVRQQVGPYRRDHTVRFVTAKKGDTFSHLALRWCGKVSPYVDEIRYLNETTNVLKEGQTVGVPWVDDEVILAGLEAQAAPTIRGAAEASLSNTLAGGASSTPAGSPRPAGQGSFRREPKLIERLDAGPASGGVAVDTVVDPLPPAAPAFTDYKVQPNDSLWKILAKKFGNGKVPKLLGPVREMNPDVNFDNLQIGVTIKLPTSAE